MMLFFNVLSLQGIARPEMKHFYLILTTILGVLPIAVFAQQNPIRTHSWSQIQEEKKGTIQIFWYTSSPFIFQDGNGKLSGIEYEIFDGFKDFLDQNYDIDLTIDWEKSDSFYNTLERVRDYNQSGIFGASAFSITPEREELVNFVKPYMPDISVMISSIDIPSISDVSRLKEALNGMTAITIKGTTYEKDLIRLRNERNINFEIEYIPSSDNILASISQKEHSFGFIDLPIYLIALQKNSALKVKRQNLIPIKREGYSFILSKNSDWQEVINEYMNSEEFSELFEKVSSQYLDKNLYEFIETLYLNAENNIILLTKEKEIQSRGLIEKSEQLRRELMFKNYLIAAIIIILIFLGLIFYLYRKGAINNRMLKNQSEQIAQQSQNIAAQKEQLENRNLELTNLNEEKNTLIKVLAHDLRSPINQIQGLANILILEKYNFSPEQFSYIKKIVDNTHRVNNMISKILDVDALESNRVNIIKEENDLVEILNQVYLNFKNEAARKNITLKFAHAVSKCLALVDRLYLIQVIENLLSNAVKFSNPDTTIVLGLEKIEARALIYVQDQGPGFTEEDKSKMFNKYQQLSAKPTSGEKSTGLGLSIVKKYVELMDGKVWVDSENGNGATFKITFMLTHP